MRLWVDGIHPVNYKPILKRALQGYKAWRESLRVVKNGRVTLSNKALAGLSKKQKDALYLLLHFIAGADDLPAGNPKIASYLDIFGIERKIPEIEKLLLEMRVWCTPDFIENFLETGSDEDLREAYLLVSQTFKTLSKFRPMKKALRNLPVYFSDNGFMKHLMILALCQILISQAEKERALS
jgi:hypothetical protein